MTSNTLYLSASLRRIEAAHADKPLMQRAGAAAADWAATLAGERGHPILVLAGPGNNGGDAFEMARLLRQRFFTVEVAWLGTTAQLPGDAAAAYQRIVDEGGSCRTDIAENQRYGLIVDGIFGIGLSRAPDGASAAAIDTANRLSQRDACPLLALDCPSGLNADTGISFSPCIQATHTLTFIAGKPGLLTADGPDCCGEIRVADLGLPLGDKLAADARTASCADFAAHLKPRCRNTHKGSFGSAGILGGAPGMLGAALLAGRAALQLGAGRVYAGLLDKQAPGVDLQQPELMLRPAENLLGADLQTLACGPGLGTSPAAGELLTAAIQSALPLVLDADALNLLCASQALENLLHHRPAATILTPHPAEAGRLLDVSVAAIQTDRLAAARQMASRYRSFVALKGCGTVIAAPDGRLWINTTGNPGMATAGMGDVLSGLIVALLAQGWPAEPALLAAVHLHGAAADRLVAQGIGPVGLTAGEVIAAARLVFNEWLSRRASL